MPENFVHLHAHTEWSALDGCGKLGDIVDAAKAKGFVAHAITDHGTASGVYQFYNLCTKAEIKPILGAEMYFVDDASIKPRTKGEVSDILIKYDKKDHDAIKERIKAEDAKRKEREHLTVLVKNAQGYRNLMDLIACSNLEGAIQGGFGRMIGRCDWGMLQQFNDGLIVGSACWGGVLAKLVLAGEIERAITRTKMLKDIFGENFFIEIMPLDTEEQRAANSGLIELAKKFDVPLAATNDCHYIEEGDALSQDILLAIQQNTSLDNMNWRFEARGLHMRTRNEMEKAFAAYHDFIPKDVIGRALDHTVVVAEQVDFAFPKASQRLPSVDINCYGDFDDFQLWRKTGGLLNLKEITAQAEDK